MSKQSRAAHRHFKATDPDRYWSVALAARELGVSRPTVYQWIANGKLTAEHVAGRLVVVRASLPAKEPSR